MLSVTKLTEKQLEEVHTLFHICQAYEALSFSPTPPDATSFLLQYSNHRLVNFVSCVFLDNLFYLYPMTHPDYRKKGFFRSALRQLEHRHKDTLFIFPVDKKSVDAIACFKKMNISKGSSEYLLSFARPYADFSYTEPKSFAVSAKKEDDIAILSSLHSRVFDYSIKDSKDHISSLCQSGAVPYIILNEKKRSVGLFFLFDYSYNNYYLCSFGILPAFRRQGLASQTLSLLAKSDTFFINKLSLQVSDQNPGALALYQHFGFFAESTVTYYNY